MRACVGLNVVRAFEGTYRRVLLNQECIGVFCCLLRRITLFACIYCCSHEFTLFNPSTREHMRIKFAANICFTCSPRVSLRKSLCNRLVVFASCGRLIASIANRIRRYICSMTHYMKNTRLPNAQRSWFGFYVLSASLFCLCTPNGYAQRAIQTLALKRKYLCVLAAKINILICDTQREHMHARC